MPRILFVAMPDSIHTARWISQIADQGWEIFLFSPYRAKPHESLKEVTFFGTDPLRPSNLKKSVRYIRWTSFFYYYDGYKKLVSNKSYSKYKETALTQIIQRIKPDIIHSLEFQHAVYLTLKVKNNFGNNKFPKWIATNWGSDIYLFRHFDEHKKTIQKVLEQCDYYSCECHRDVKLAHDMGFQGEILPVLPNAGGININHIKKGKQKGPISDRKVIILKGYDGWAGRALVAFQAFRLCQKELKNYTIVIYSATKNVEIAAKLFSLETGLQVKVLPKISHQELLGFFGKARIYIGLSISDGISTSFLEAITMGAFPIQSYTACADEWIEDGKSGYIVPPEEPTVIADAIRRALTDDNLVNRAAEINAQTAVDRLDYSNIQAQVIKMYRNIYDSQKE